MKTNIVPVLICLTMIGASSAQTRVSPEQDAIHFIEEYDRAWNHKDAAAVERALAPGYLYFSSKGDVVSRQQTLDMVRSPKYALTSAERSEVKAYVISRTAVVSSRWKGHGSFGGKEFHDDQRCSVVLVREGQGWLVMSEHCTQIVAP
jgi:ketosteroid isomerase-like protein